MDSAQYPTVLDGEFLSSSEFYDLSDRLSYLHVFSAHMISICVCGGRGAGVRELAKAGTMEPFYIIRFGIKAWALSLYLVQVNSRVSNIVSLRRLRTYTSLNRDLFIFFKDVFI